MHIENYNRLGIIAIKSHCQINQSVQLCDSGCLAIGHGCLAIGHGCLAIGHGCLAIGHVAVSLIDPGFLLK